MMTGPDAVGRKPDGSSSVPPVVDAAPATVVTPRSRALRLAWIAIAVILVGVVVLVTYALTRPPSTPRVVHRPATSSDVISALAEVPSSMFDSVGVTVPATRLVVPTVLSGQPPLTSGGKPEVLFVGGEFCPFCGAERWPLIVALSRFGHFSRLSNMQSAQYSVFPGVQTFSFVGSHYTSPYVSFSGTELYSGAVDAQGVYAQIGTLDPQQAFLMARYGTAPVKRGSAAGSFPFVDVGNVMVTSTSGFSPGLIVGQSQGSIVDDLTQPSDPIGQAIVASANYLTAGICAATGGHPASTCDDRGVRAAASALGLQ
jgi:hypothetical protein